MQEEDKDNLLYLCTCHRPSLRSMTRNFYMQPDGQIICLLDGNRRDHVNAWNSGNLFVNYVFARGSYSDVFTEWNPVVKEMLGI